MSPGWKPGQPVAAATVRLKPSSLSSARDKCIDETNHSIWRDIVFNAYLKQVDLTAIFLSMKPTNTSSDLFDVEQILATFVSIGRLH